jgi:hypothetical protein
MCATNGAVFPMELFFFHLRARKFGIVCILHASRLGRILKEQKGKEVETERGIKTRGIGPN